MSDPSAVRRVLLLVDTYLDAYGGTEGQIRALVQGLPAGTTAELWVLRGPVHWLLDRGFPCRWRHLGLGSLARPGTLLRLRALARRVRRFDLLQTYTNDASIVGPLLGAWSGVPVVVSRRDLGFWQTPRLLPVLRRTGRLARAFAANCEAVARHTVASEHVPPGQVLVLPNGHDPQRFEVPAEPWLRERLDIPAGAPLVGLLANVKPLKRHDDLLDALALLAAAGSDAHVLCIGDVVESGPPLQERARRRGVADRVHVTAALGNAIPLLKHLDVGVLCSETEGLSNAVIEYMACGLPVVATNVGGTPDLVAHEENGLLVEVGDVPALADAISGLLADRERAAAMGRAARRRFEEGFTLERMVRRTVEAWAQVVEAPAPPREDLAFEVVEDVETLEALAPAWDALLRRDQLFLSPDWVIAWLRHGESKGTPHVLVARDAAGRLAGVVPLVRLDDVLGFAGQGEGADHLDVVAARGRARAVARGALALLGGRSWRRLRFLHLSEGGALRAALREPGLGLPYGERLSTVCPYVATEGFEDYAAYVRDHFSYASRRNVRRYPKRFRGLEGAAVERITDPRRAAEALDRFFALHDARREASALDPAPVRAFHRALVERAARAGRLALTFLKLGGRDVACEYGFRHGKKLYAFQSGLDESAPFESPGLVLQAIVLEEDVFGGGLEEYDFLDGREPYKRRWATGERRLFDVEVHPPTPEGRAACLLHGAARLAWDVARAGPAAPTASP